jgi:hypothetical protein
MKGNTMKMLRISAVVLLFAVIIASSGCTYLRARGRDALDIMDIGITVTDKWTPDFGLYGDFFQLTPIGFTHIDGKVLGIGNRQIGLMDYENKSWGVILWGSDMKGTGIFNPEDPHQARPSQRDATERPRFNTGAVRMIAQGEPGPWTMFFECDRGIHLGWIGVHFSVRPLDLVDFILGWTTLDIMGDDDAIPLGRRAK